MSLGSPTTVLYYIIYHIDFAIHRIQKSFSVYHTFTGY